MKNETANYMQSQEFKNHEAQVMNHINKNVPSQFQKRVELATNLTN